MTLTSPALLCICHLILPPFTLSHDLDTHCIHYLILIFLILIPDPVTLSRTHLDTWVQWTFSSCYQDPLTVTCLICSYPVGWST